MVEAEAAERFAQGVAEQLAPPRELAQIRQALDELAPQIEQRTKGLAARAISAAGPDETR